MVKWDDHTMLFVGWRFMAVFLHDGIPLPQTLPIVHVLIFLLGVLNRARDLLFTSEVVR